MNWLYPIFILIGLVILVCSGLALVWLTAKIARNEPLQIHKKPPPSPIYDTAQQRNQIRKEAREANEMQFKEIDA